MENERILLIKLAEANRIEYAYGTINIVTYKKENYVPIEESIYNFLKRMKIHNDSFINEALAELNDNPKKVIYGDGIPF